MGLRWGEVILNRQVAGPYYEMGIILPETARQAVPGQFLLVKCGSGPWPLLRRPFSLYWVDRDWGLVGLLYQVKGQGTEELRRVAPGQMLEVMGPLGQGFPLPETAREIWLVAGGVGIAPLFFLAREVWFRGKQVRVFCGAATRDGLLAVEALTAAGIPVTLATEDGSAGRPGTVVELLEEVLAAGQPDVLYACGPQPMLVAVARVARACRVRGYASLESSMACGLGVCQGCVVLLHLPGGGTRYARVCRDGPVFGLEYLIPGV